MTLSRAQEEVSKISPPGPEGEPEFEFASVSKWFVKGRERIQAVQGLDLRVARGEFLSVVGPSGCGKSTLLNMVAGLMRPSRGTVSQRGEQVRGVNTTVGYITQQDNLLPWATVSQNIELPLRIRRVPREERRRRVAEYIARIGLEGFERHYPAELSGGMRKRASLARTLIYDPETLLMDEPFSALDAQVKLLMHEQLLDLWEGSGRTIIFITHDLDEAITLSDRVCVMSSRPGKLKMEQRIELPRPRDPLNVRHHPEFGQIFETLWHSLKDDIRSGTEA